MQQFFSHPQNRPASSTVTNPTWTFIRSAKILWRCFACLLFIYFLPGCIKEERSSSSQELQVLAGTANMANRNPIVTYENLEPQTIWELQQVRAATARYRQLKNALKDGYVDIKAIVPGMGHHYMKLKLVDAKFELRKPEILVYDKLPDGSFSLVAVEYALPTALLSTAPDGFTGTQDVWVRNNAVGMWFLHAWVWLSNPDGIFNPTNRLVHTH